MSLYLSNWTSTSNATLADEITAIYYITLLTLRQRASSATVTVDGHRRLAEAPHCIRCRRTPIGRTVYRSDCGHPLAVRSPQPFDAQQDALDLTADLNQLHADIVALRLDGAEWPIHARLGGGQSQCHRIAVGVAAGAQLDCTAVRSGDAAVGGRTGGRSGWSGWSGCQCRCAVLAIEQDHLGQ